MTSQRWFSCASTNLVHLLLTLLLATAILHGSEWDINCRFIQNNKNVFWTGDSIEGFVDFVNIDHTGLKLERINADLVGELVRHVTHKKNGRESKTISHELFFNQRILVHPIGGVGKFPIPYGNNSWPFRFHLNNSLPPSFHSNTT